MRTGNHTRSLLLLEIDRQSRKRQAGFFMMLILASFALLASCAPSYDEKADKDISDLQQKVDLQIVQLISIDRQIGNSQNNGSADSIKLTKSATHAANIDFYNAIDSGLTHAQMEVDRFPDLSRPKIDQTFMRLREILVDNAKRGDPPTSMQAVHAAQGRLSEPFLMSTRTQANAEFATLMQYEGTIKSGNTPSK